jgi:hypothetical protein
MSCEEIFIDSKLIFLLPVLRDIARLISYLLHFELLHFLFRSQDISVGMTGYGLDGQGSIPGRGDLSLLHSIQTISRDH